MILQKECENEVLGANAILWKHFPSPAMQKCIEQELDFESKIRDTHVALFLIEVKSASETNGNAKAILPAQSVLQSSRRHLNMCQKPDQSVADHLKSFKAEKDVLVAQAVDMMFTQLMRSRPVERLPEEKKAETKAILEAGVKEVCVVLFFVGADVTKRGSPRS